MRELNSTLNIFINISKKKYALFEVIIFTCMSIYEKKNFIKKKKYLL